MAHCTSVERIAAPRSTPYPGCLFGEGCCSCSIAAGWWCAMEYTFSDAAGCCGHCGCCGAPGRCQCGCRGCGGCGHCDCDGGACGHCGGGGGHCGGLAAGWYDDALEGGCICGGYVCTGAAACGKTWPTMWSSASCWCGGCRRESVSESCATCSTSLSAGSAAALYPGMWPDTCSAGLRGAAAAR